MNSATFDENGFDRKSFAPFVLQNCSDTEWKDVCLSFDDWAFIQKQYGSDTINDYYMNGYGVEGLTQMVH